MNSNESTLQCTIVHINDYLEQDDRARWLADVLCVWDWGEGNWLAGAPYVIRTEMCDIELSWPDGKHLQVSTDPVDSHVTHAGIGPDGDNPAASDRVSWLPYVGLKQFVGARIESLALDVSEREDSLWVSFENGECVRIAPSGVMVLLSMGMPAIA